MDGRDDRTTARAQGLVLTTMTTTLFLSVCGVDADDDGVELGLRLINVKRVPVRAMPESFGGEYCCLFVDRLWDDHIAVLPIHELAHLIRKPQKRICIILAPTVALVQQVVKKICHRGFGFVTFVDDSHLLGLPDINI